MFSPHLTIIYLERKEPSKNFEKSIFEYTKIFNRECFTLAQRVVDRDAIISQKETKRTQKKIENLIETDERKKYAKKFMEKWNYWRKFYLDLPPAKIKTKGQLTCIENIIQLAKDKKVNLNMLIATTHKSYSLMKKRKFNPTFATVIYSGLAYYEEFYEDVLSDLDSQDYEN